MNVVNPIDLRWFLCVGFGHRQLKCFIHGLTVSLIIVVLRSTHHFINKPTSFIISISRMLTKFAFEARRRKKRVCSKNGQSNINKYFVVQFVWKFDDGIAGMSVAIVPLHALRTLSEEPWSPHSSQICRFKSSTANSLYYSKYAINLNMIDPYFYGISHATLLKYSAIRRAQSHSNESTASITEQSVPLLLVSTQCTNNIQVLEMIWNQ